jgi:3-deoxy-7-phosphoheptulonate synthase
MACAAVAARADGVHIEVHSRPERALSDGSQALLPAQYATVMQQIQKIAAVMGQTISTAGGAPCGGQR